MSEESTGNFAQDLEAALIAGGAGETTPSTPSTEVPTTTETDPGTTPTASATTDPGQPTAEGGTGEGTPTDPPQTEPELPPLVARLKEMGRDVSQYKSDDDVLKGFIHQQELIGRNSEFVHLGKAMRENPAAVFAQYAQHFGYVPAQQAQQQQQQTPAQQQPKLTPELLTQWQQAVERDDAGNITGVKPGHDPQIIQRLREAEQQAARTQLEFLTDPAGFILKQTASQQEQVRELIAQELRQHQQAQMESLEAQSFLKENRHWLIDDATQQLSGNGQVFLSLMNEGMRIGIPQHDTQALTTYALRGMSALAAQQQRTNPPPPVPRQTAVTKPGVNTSPPVREEGEYNEGESFTDALLRNLKLEGSAT